MDDHEADIAVRPDVDIDDETYARIAARLNDSKPPIPHRDAMARIRATIERLARQR